MKKPPPPPTKETLALQAAFERARMSQAAVAKYMGTTPGMVWQWLRGQRPVPANKAERLSKLLSAKPHQISAAFGEVVPEESSNVVPLRRVAGDAPIRTDLAINRLENDVDALRYALGAIIVTMVSHRQAEAADVAKRIRDSVPAKFLDRGLLFELLEVLGSAGGKPKG